MVTRKLIPDWHKFLQFRALHIQHLLWETLEVTGETKLCMLFPIFSDNIKLLHFLFLFSEHGDTEIYYSNQGGLRQIPSQSLIHRTFKWCHRFFSLSQYCISKFQLIEGLEAHRVRQQQTGESSNNIILHSKQQQFWNQMRKKEEKNSFFSG